jgi:HlyD family secretion protein
MVDIARPSNARGRRIRSALYGAGALVVVIVITLGLSRLKPAPPTVERATVWIDTVKRGPMIRNVRGVGTLVPEDIRWIPATTVGRVERIVLRPGTVVTPGSIILELSNPTLEQELQDVTLRLRASEASLKNLKVQLQNDYLQQQASAASIEAEMKRAVMQADVNDQLAAKQLVSTLIVKQSRLDADQLATRYEIAMKQLATHAESMQARIAVQDSEIAQVRALVALRQRQVDELRVRAGVDGVLQLVPVEVGQQVAPGTNLARVADPGRLKAELKVPETQAKDVQIGQLASIDTRVGVVDGRVVRIDPSVQNGTVTIDVTMPAALPKGARPDLSVDGTIELERLNDVVFVGRPTFGQDQSVVGLFKLQPGGAERVQVKLGRSSVDRIEILSGLAVGDQVILSDMSQWDAFDRVRLQ